MVELVDTKDLKSLPFLGVPVQVRPRAPVTNMRILLIFLVLVLGCSKNTKILFTSKENKPNNVNIEGQFDGTYILKNVGNYCSVILNAKNISNTDKRASFTVSAVSYDDKKYEAYVIGDKVKPSEAVNLEAKFVRPVDCNDFKKIEISK